MRSSTPLPSLDQIIMAWAELGSDELEQIFPGLYCRWIGWGEPFCFRCGWLAPGPEAADFPTEDADKSIVQAWRAATGWLERAHLCDDQYAGSAELLNLVPLCVLCHETQPPCESREEGIAFVNSGCNRPIWAIQLVTDGLYRDIRHPGKGLALRKMLRAGMLVAEVLNDELIYQQRMERGR
jgi:hypothetical protein